MPVCSDDSRSFSISIHVLCFVTVKGRRKIGRELGREESWTAWDLVVCVVKGIGYLGTVEGGTNRKLRGRKTCTGRNLLVNRDREGRKCSEHHLP